MLVRPTVRVLLLDRDDRLLLIKCHLPDLAGRPAIFWATAGGGLEPAETIQDAAIGETFEETGICGIELGPVVWTGEAVLTFPGEETMCFRQSYIVARCTAGPLGSDGWTQQERDTILDMRWWTLDELRAAAEPLDPPALAELLVDVIAGNYPSVPITVRQL